MPKSPDAAPIDYSIWEYLKQQLNKQKIEALDELLKKISNQWKKIDQCFIDKVLSNWPKRVYFILKDHGYHLEHLLKI